MAADADNIVIAGSGSVHVAPVGTAMPATPIAALNAAFVDLGYVTEDGATFRDDKTKEGTRVWGSFYPVKMRVTDASASLSFVLRQWDIETVPFAFGGGSIATTTGPPAHYTYTPPAPDEIDERALVLEWAADGHDFRLLVPRVMVTEGVETQLTQTAESDLPITLGVLGTAGVDPWQLLTNHPAFAAS